MANRCYQTIELWGKPEKIKEVIDYVISQKECELVDQWFGSKVFPISRCSIGSEDIFLEQKYCSVDFSELSELFPEVGFHSHSLTDGEGNVDEYYVLNGRLLFYRPMHCVQDDDIYYGGNYPSLEQEYPEAEEEWEKIVGISIKNSIRKHNSKEGQFDIPVDKKFFPNAE